MNKMIIKDGRFFKDGKFIQPIFGDDEQVACLQMFNETVESLTKDGLIVEPNYEVQIDAYVHFNCICGTRLQKAVGADAEEDIHCFINKKVICKECNRIYIFKADEGDNLIVKLI